MISKHSHLNFILCLINLYVERGQVCHKNASTIRSLKGIEIQKNRTSELEGILLMVIELVYVRVRTRNLHSKYSPFLKTVVSSEALFTCDGSSNEEWSNPIISTPQHMVYKPTALSLTSYYQATGAYSATCSAKARRAPACTETFCAPPGTLCQGAILRKLANRGSRSPEAC